MAAWFTSRPEEDEAEDEANLWTYDSTWEGEEEDEEEDGGGGEPEGAAAEEPEDAGEQPGHGRAGGCRHSQVRVGGTGTERSLRAGRDPFQTFLPGPRSRSPFPTLPAPFSRARPLPGRGTASSVPGEAPRPSGASSAQNLSSEEANPPGGGGGREMLSLYGSPRSLTLP